MKARFAPFHFVVRLLRELSDEAAYRRYLQATGLERSPLAWKQFTDCRYKRKYQSPKCC